MLDRTTTDGILTIRLAHGRASAMDIELVEALARAVAEAGQSDARAVVVAGSGSIFSAGVDLFRLVGTPASPMPHEESRAYAKRFVPALVRMFLDVFTLPKPLVVAVNGHAIAGGCILALAGDYRLMSSGGGRIGIPEMLVGVPFPPAVIEILRYAVAPPHLQTLMYSGRSVTPDEALRMGLVDEVVAPESLESRALEMARQLAALSPRNFALSKQQLRERAVNRARHYGHELDAEVVELWGDPERHQAIRDYLARTVKQR